MAHEYKTAVLNIESCFKAQHDEIVRLSAQNTQLQARVADLTSKLQSAESEKQKLKSSNMALQDSFKGLEEFRFNILKMVDQIPKDQQKDLKTSGSSAGQTQNTLFNTNLADSRFLGADDHINSDESKGLNYSLSSVQDTSLLLEQLAPLRNTQPVHALPSLPSVNPSSKRVSKSSSTSQMRDLDPATLYRLIRHQLSPPEFQTFADSVTMFNEGRMSASQTVKAVQEIVGKGVLCDQMTRLILDAVRASRE